MSEYIIEIGKDITEGQLMGEIVRCQDCRWSRRRRLVGEDEAIDERKCFRFRYEDGEPFDVPGYGFCFKGERREYGD